VLGYSTDGRVFHSVPPLQPAQLPPGTAVGWYADSSNLAHVLTRTPFHLSLFKQGGWGDPTYTSLHGPALTTRSKFRALPHPADRTLLLLTRIAVHSQARISATVTGPHGTRASILGKGSRFGALLKTGTFQRVQAYRRKPGTLQVRLRLNARTLLPGSYRLRVVAVDPWGRHGRKTLRFRYR
jgi:predicted alpha/beta hydrolase